MPTIKQKTAFNKMLENVSQHNPKTAGQILAESGYKKISKQPTRIFDSKGFKELLAQIDDGEILKKFYSILLSDDKRASMDAGKELLKLKDRYPATTSKIIGLFDKIGELEKKEPEEEEESKAYNAES